MNSQRHALATGVENRLLREAVIAQVRPRQAGGSEQGLRGVP